MAGLNELDRLVIDMDALAREWGASRKDWSNNGGISFHDAATLLKEISMVSAKLSKMYAELVG